MKCSTWTRKRRAGRGKEGARSLHHSLQSETSPSLKTPPPGKRGSQRQRSPGGPGQVGPSGNPGVSHGCYSAPPFQDLNIPIGCLKGQMLLILLRPSPPAPAPQSHQPSEMKGMKSFIPKGSRDQGSPSHCLRFPRL